MYHQIVLNSATLKLLQSCALPTKLKQNFNFLLLCKLQQNKECSAEPDGILTALVRLAQTLKRSMPHPVDAAVWVIAHLCRQACSKCNSRLPPHQPSECKRAFSLCVRRKDAVLCSDDTRMFSHGDLLALCRRPLQLIAHSCRRPLSQQVLLCFSNIHSLSGKQRLKISYWF